MRAVLYMAHPVEPGDQLYVKETHAVFHVGEGMDRPVPECCAYRATCAPDGSFDYIRTDGDRRKW